MTKAALPDDEEERLETLRGLGILDTESEPAFDRIVEIACKVFDVPIALVSLVDSDRQWFKAKSGVTLDETHRDHAICAHAILSDQVLVIPDTKADPRTQDNPLADGDEGLRFYAGAPLIAPSGHRLGTFCILDRKPRQLSVAQIEQLRAFAAITVELLVFRQDAATVGLERSRAERIERRLRDAIEALPEGFALYDRDDRLVLFNDAYLRLYADSAEVIKPGNTFETIIRYGIERGQYPEAKVHPHGPEGWLAERVHSHRNPSEPIEQLLDGGRWLRIQETKTQSDEIVGFRVDISGQKRVSETLRRLQRMSSNDAMGFTEKCQALARIGREIMGFELGVVIDVSEAEASLLACDSDPDVSVPFVAGQTIEIGDGPIRRAMDSGVAMVVPQLETSSLSGRDGPEFTCEARSVLAVPVVLDGRAVAVVVFFQLSEVKPLHDEHRDLAGVMVDWLGMEIRRRRALSALRDAKEEAEQASRAKSRFLAMMSHELRTPMKCVIGILDLLHNTGLDDEQQNMLDLAKHSAENLLVILNDILDFSKLEAGRLDFEAVPFDLSSLISDVTGLLGPQSSAHGIRLLTVVDTRIPLLRVGDPTRVRQVLMNLVSNAIKFTKQGSVLIQVQADDQSTGPAQDHAIKISVTDTGIGIPPERQGALFQEFSQLDSSVARQFGGTGLGLAICKRLTDAMNGRVWLESSGPEGTSFAFTLPMPLQAEAEAEASDPAGGPDADPLSGPDADPLKGMKVLVVDENAVALDAVGRQIEIWGAGVARAENLEQARAELARDTPDVIVVHEAPQASEAGPTGGGTGGTVKRRELAHTLRGEVGSDRTRIIVTQTPGLGMKLSGSKAADQVLTEPLGPSRMLQALRAVRAASEGGTGEGAGRSDHLSPVGGRLRSNRELSKSDRPLNILVAEDNPVNQSLMIRALDRMGHRSTMASNGLEAYSNCCANSYDVVLMDIEMPEMDGVEAVRWIRERLDEKAPPFIAMTAHVMEGSRDWLMASGFSEYLSKPLKLSALQAMLDAISDVKYPSKNTATDTDKDTGAEAAEAAEKPEVSADPSDANDTPDQVEGLIDEDRLSELREVLPAEVFGEITGQFLNSADEYLVELKTHFDAGDIPATGRSAHAIKGLALNFGAPELARLAAVIEDGARASDPEVDPSTIETLSDVTTRTRKALDDNLAG